MNNIYKAMVYVDQIEKWQECEVINVSAYRAIVKTKYGTQLNRVFKYTNEIKEDGCIYFIKKQ